MQNLKNHFSRFGIGLKNYHKVNDSIFLRRIKITTPIELTAGTEGNVLGTSNGTAVDVYYRTSSPEGTWEVFETGVTVTAGAWTATGTIADADTYDFLAVDADDTDGYAQQDDVVVVASGETAKSSMDATCTADTPESVEAEAGTSSMDATCTADTPTSV